jgi:hypothetical protein
MSDNVTNMIELAEIDKELDISEFGRYKTVIFHWFNDSQSSGFTWTAIPLGGGTYKGEPIKDLPRKDNGRRKGFTTIDGAKRNFIKQLG